MQEEQRMISEEKLLPELEDLLQKIRMPEKAAEVILCTARSLTEKDGLPDSTEQMPGAGILTEHLLTAVRNRSRGQWNRIPENIYIDTMKCFTRFVGEHFASYGYYGFDRGFWTTRQITARLFRIGQLEYEQAEGTDREIICTSLPIRYSGRTP